MQSSYILYILLVKVFNNIGKRIELLEEENVKLRDAAYKLQSVERKTMPYVKKSLKAEDEVSDWVRERIKM